MMESEMWDESGEKKGGGGGYSKWADRGKIFRFG